MKEERYSNYTPLNFFGNAYDAMWVVAYGLDLVDKWAQNGTINDECENNYTRGELVRLDLFNYTNIKMGCYMEKAFHQVKITGITVSNCIYYCIVDVKLVYVIIMHVYIRKGTY